MIHNVGLPRGSPEIFKGVKMLKHTNKVRFDAFLRRMRAVAKSASMFDAKTEKIIVRLSQQIWDVSRKSYKEQRSVEILAEIEAERQRVLAARRQARSAARP